MANVIRVGCAQVTGSDLKLTLKSAQRGVLNCKSVVSFSKGCLPVTFKSESVPSRVVCIYSGPDPHSSSDFVPTTNSPTIDRASRLPKSLAVAIEPVTVLPETGGPASGGGFNGKGGDGDDGGGGDEGHGGSDGHDGKSNRADALAVLAALGRSLETLPKELGDAIMAGRVPGAIVERFAAMEKSPILGRLVNISGFQERLLADDLFFAKIFFECGIGMFTKAGAEYERRKDKFMKEIDFVVADVVMALFADFMLVYLPAPTIALRAPAAVSANKMLAFFARCPDNAFQMALGGSKISMLHRCGCVVRNGSKLMVVGTLSSLIGTAVTNALIASRKTKEAAEQGKESEKGAGELPLIETSVAYGAYMAVSSNLRYQMLAGVIEQRMLDPLLRNHKIALSGVSFLIRTLNTYVGSLLWVDYARWIGIQSHDD